MIVFEIEQPDQSQPSQSIIKAKLRHVKGSLVLFLNGLAVISVGPNGDAHFHMIEPEDQSRLPGINFDERDELAIGRGPAVERSPT